jgi:glutamate N-acetyltransferase/amino-acid acetyltransferase
VVSDPRRSGRRIHHQQGRRRAGCWTPARACRPRIRAIVANSGNANALTGPAGLDDVAVIRSAVADALGVQKRAVLTASTGVIGAPLPAMKIVTALPALVDQLGDHPDLAAEAIMTTDTRPKMAAREVTLGGKAAIVSAICKGSGMLAPQLATTLCLVTTDAAVTPKALQEVLTRAVHGTLNMVTVDGEMSTNDCVIALANGLAGNPRISEPGPDLEVLESALTDLLGEMGRAMAADGEGATKLLEVVVTGAPGDEAARDCARSIASSPLVKASLFGADPNWGRILSTVGARAGAAGYPIDPFKARVSLQGIVVFGRARPSSSTRRTCARACGEPDRRCSSSSPTARPRGRLGLRPLLRLRESTPTTPRSSSRSRTAAWRGRRVSTTAPPSSVRCSPKRSSTSPPSPARSPSSSTAARPW